MKIFNLKLIYIPLGIGEASLFMCQGGAAFSYGGAENWRRGLGGAKKSVVDF